ncbi:PBPb domain-containing protein [Aphelenchoides fujianensis]|nr:PBPb domain-containing protein [Aphelenchoides fujianensis]
MSGPELRVYFAPYYPAAADDCRRFPTLKVTPYCPFPGLIVEILHLLSQDANFTIVPYSWQTLGFANEDDVTIRDLVVAIRNGTLDLMGMGFQKTQWRETQLHFSEPLYIVNTRLLRKTNEKKLQQVWIKCLKLPFRTYSPETWYAFLAVCLVQWAFCVLVRRFEAYTRREQPVGVLECAWQVFRLTLLQPERTSFRAASGSFSFCIYSILNCSILLGVFGSFILASIIRPKEDVYDPFRALLDSVQAGRNYMVTNDPNNWFYEQINRSNDFPFLELRRAMEKNPLRTVWTRAEALDAVINDRGLLFQQMDEGSFFTAKSYCGLTPLERNMPTVPAHFMLRPFHPLLPRLNWAIKRNRVRIQNIFSKYYRQAKWNDRCRDTHLPSSLPIGPYSGLGLVCVVVLAVALVTLGAEVVHERCRSYLDRRLQPVIRHWRQRHS